MSTRVLSGREALQEWLLVCVNLARRSGVLTHHSNDLSEAQARDWVTVTGIRPQATVTGEEMYAMAEQLSQAFAQAAIAYSNDTPDADSVLTDKLLTTERDELRAKVKELEARLAMVALHEKHPQIAKYEEWLKAQSVGPYAHDDAANTIELHIGARRVEALRELRNEIPAMAWQYLVRGGDAAERASYLRAVQALWGERLSILATALGLDRERDSYGRIEPDADLRTRLWAWKAPPRIAPSASVGSCEDD